MLIDTINAAPPRRSTARARSLHKEILILPDVHALVSHVRNVSLKSLSHTGDRPFREIRGKSLSLAL